MRPTRATRLTAVICLTVLAAVGNAAVPQSGAASTAGSETVDAQTVADLRQALEAQRAQLESQEQLLEAQRAALDSQRKELERQATTLAALSSYLADEDAQTLQEPVDYSKRDAVGDLNSKSLQEGVYEGSVTTVGNGISLSIGGFLKTLAIFDSNAETMGADLLPATLGVFSDDKDGAFSLDSTMTRLYLDASAQAPLGTLHGYLETDLNDGNDGQIELNLRHAYGAWTNRYGTLLVGHTWSTFMDLKTLPQALSEPTFSGAAFTRQPQVRWSQPLGSGFTWHAALENPDSDDVFNPQGTRTVGRSKVPDVVMGLELEGPRGHLRLNGIAREIRVNLAPEEHDNTFAGGVALTGSLRLSPTDRFTFGGVTGEGLGRYLLGIQPINGAAINPTTNELETRDNRGIFGNYTHNFNKSLTGAVMLGYAEADPLDFDDDDTLKDTSYAGANLIWTVLPYLSVGIEYDYARRENKGGADLDDHRVMFGVQIY